MQLKKILFIVNPFAGVSKKKSFGTLVDQYLDKSIYDYKIKTTDFAGHAVELCKDAVSNDYYMVIAVGGDGTINEVASSLVGTQTILGIVPTGSGNGFAGHLQLSKEIPKAIETLNKGKVLSIDSCTCNGKFYTNVAGVGFDGYISNLIKGKSQRGQILYAFQMIKAIFNYRSKKYQIAIDGQNIKDEIYYCVAIANASTYGYQFQIAPQAELTDGLMDVVLIKNASIYKHLISLRKYFIGKAAHIEHLEMLKAKSVTIRSNTVIEYHVDGEGYTTDSKMHYEILPLSLMVMTDAKKKN